MSEEPIRKCKKCGTEFKEILVPKTDVIDHPPECHYGNKLNGVCINCCGCNSL